MSRKYRNNGALVLPAFKETESIFNLLHELDLNLPLDWNFIVVDDSPTSETEQFVKKAFGELKRSPTKLHLLRNFQKTGRGAAVQQGILFATTFLDAEFIIEMDSDGSHTAGSVISLIQAPKEEEFVIGSRYLPESRIIGWSLSRRIFSRLTNKLLRSIFNIKIRDWTNGLRRYTAKAVEVQNHHIFQNKGFICLSEQILVLYDYGIAPFEVPISFVDRTHGASTVTQMEIRKSLRGIVELFISRAWKH
jgi:dolichol-phosphate mannosyltransferase